VAAPSAWKTVWITGASSGIGRAMAIQLAAEGVMVAASARTADAVANMGSSVRPYPLDVTDPTASRETVRRIEAELGPIDLAVLGAGRYTPVSAHAIDPDLFGATMATNYMGVVNGLAALLPGMLERRRGHVSWIASVAGYRGLPKAAAYGPSKAALINLAESLQPELSRAGIRVSVINPGFVETPMTAQNDFKMPFLIPADEAGRRTIAGLRRGQFEVAYPRRFVGLLKLARMLPYRLYFPLIDRVVNRGD
jgi:NAD(P)-dependent dehydrogenase (short-subunit alcohol dehydrogenase family)